MIDKKNKNFENLSKKGSEIRDKLICSDEKIFEFKKYIMQVVKKISVFAD